MEEETLSTLESLGLSQNEAKVYLTLIKLGPTTATEIAKEGKLHRPNVYDSLKSLIDKGLVSHMNAENTKKFSATDPKNLTLLLKQKELDILKILPKLELEKTLSNKNETFAEVHEGLKAFRICYYNMLEYGKPFYAFGIPKIVPQVVGPFIEGFHKERVRRKIMFKHIYNDDVKDRIDYLNSMAYTEAVYLPEKFNSPVTTILCGPEVLIVRWQPLVFIRIMDQSLATAYQNYCEQLIDFAKKLRSK